MNKRQCSKFKTVYKNLHFKIILNDNGAETLPMLEPKVSSYARSRVRTPLPTIGVNIDVKDEEDWTKKVMTPPMDMAT